MTWSNVTADLSTFAALCSKQQQQQQHQRAGSSRAPLSQMAGAASTAVRPAPPRQLAGAASTAVPPAANEHKHARVHVTNRSAAVCGGGCGGGGGREIAGLPVQVGGASTSPSVNGAVRAAAVGGGGAPTTVLLLRRLPSVVGDAVPNPQPHQLPRLRRAFGCDWLFFFGSDDVSGGGSLRCCC